MISVRCDKCNEELCDAGGLAFSPPQNSSEVIKYHLCRKCWTLFIAWLNSVNSH